MGGGGGAPPGPGARDARENDRRGRQQPVLRDVRACSGVQYYCRLRITGGYTARAVSMCRQAGCQVGQSHSSGMRVDAAEGTSRGWCGDGARSCLRGRGYGAGWACECHDVERTHGRSRRALASGPHLTIPHLATHLMIPGIAFSSHASPGGDPSCRARDWSCTDWMCLNNAAVPAGVLEY